jgi:hypothetical protein
VFIIPDNDAAGRKRADAVLKAIEGHVASARVLELPNLPDKGDVSDWLDAGGTIDELIRLTENLAHADANDDLGEFFTLFDAIELDTYDEYLIDEVLPNQGIGYLIGASYTTKTFAALDLSLSIARGVPFAGKYEARRGAAVFIALEAPAGIRKRIVAYKQEHGVKSAHFALLKYLADLCDPGSVAGLIDLLKRFAAHIGVRIRLLVIDTLSKAMAGARRKLQQRHVARDQAPAADSGGNRWVRDGHPSHRQGRGKRYAGQLAPGGRCGFHPAGEGLER